MVCRAALRVIGGALRGHPGVVTSHRATNGSRAGRSMVANIDCQPAVHDTRVELHRLGETNREPDRDDSRKGAKDQGALHVSNIDGWSGQERRD